MKITLDFESRSRVDIWSCGAWAYSVHPSTEILCLAYAFGDGEVQLLRREDLSLIPPWKVEGNIFSAFNSFFEMCMYNNIMVKKWGWPRIPINQWSCSMAKSLASAYPQSLANACKAVNTPFQKSSEGHSVMLKMCKPNSKGEFNEDLEDFEKLYQYCIEDVLAERSLDEMLPDLIPAEKTIRHLDQLVNQRGIRIDTEAVGKALRFIDEYSTRLNNVVFSESGFVLDGVTRRQAVLDWCKSQGVDVTSYTKADVAKTLEVLDLPENVRTVLETKLQLGKTSVAKYQALQNATTEDGRLRDTLIYHGASTGRWTGKLFQLQNLPKGNVSDTGSAIELLKKETLETFEIFYPDVMGTLSSCIRGMIISAPDTELFVGDYSAIEARVVMWLAGEEYGLKQWAEGKDLYVEMAKRVYGIEKVTKQQRALGKAIILGCGFGMGKVKFEATCKSWGIPVTPELAERAVNTYRETYGKVKSLWYAQEGAAIGVLKAKASYREGSVLWFMENNNLKCKLPSGRSLTYPEASLDYEDTSWGDRKLTIHYMAVDSKTNRWVKEKTYGGKLVENITQAVARDILAEAMLRLEREEYPVIFSVHDEIVCEVPENKKSLADYNEILCESPKWAAGLPIKAECWSGTRYKKG